MHGDREHRTVRLACAVAVLATASALGAMGVAAQADAVGVSGSTPQIAVLSSRADLITGGVALVSVALPAGTDPTKVTMTLGTVPVTSQFRVRPNGLYEGLLAGLKLGPNTLTAKTASGAT